MAAALTIAMAVMTAAVTWFSENDAPPVNLLALPLFLLLSLGVWLGSRAGAALLVVMYGVAAVLAGWEMSKTAIIHLALAFVSVRAVAGGVVLERAVVAGSAARRWGRRAAVLAGVLSLPAVGVPYLLWEAGFPFGPRSRLMLLGDAEDVELEEQGLLAARRARPTKLMIVEPPFAKWPADPPPDGISLIKYQSPAGELAAYLTDDPRDGEKHPAVLWAKGGFGGPGAFLWEEAPVENDQSVRAFLNAGIVVMAPSWRAELDNPGRFELFFGEVEDYLAALEHLRSLPYVDADRVYLAGHSTGGTMVLLAATATDRFRAAFSFGGAAELGWLHERSETSGIAYGNTPYDWHDPREHDLRSALYFVKHIERPTFYFEGGFAPDAQLMGEVAALHDVPMRAFIVENGDHFDILQPLEAMLVQKILETRSA